jgi:hypothetical protein
MTLWWILSARTSKFKSRESYGCRNHYDSTRAPIASLQRLFRLSICSLLLAKCPPEIACHTRVLCVVCCVLCAVCCVLCVRSTGQAATAQGNGLYLRDGRLEIGPYARPHS